MIAERTIEVVPKAKLRSLVGDMVQLDELIEGKPGAAPLLAEVRKVQEASLCDDYDNFDVNSKNFIEKFEEAEALIAESNDSSASALGRKGTGAPVREAFELLAGLLRHIDDDPIPSSSSPTRLAPGRLALTGRPRLPPNSNASPIARQPVSPCARWTARSPTPPTTSVRSFSRPLDAWPAPRRRRGFRRLPAGRGAGDAGRARGRGPAPRPDAHWESWSRNGEVCIAGLDPPFAASSR